MIVSAITGFMAGALIGSDFGWWRWPGGVLIAMVGVALDTAHLWLR